MKYILFCLLISFLGLEACTEQAPSPVSLHGRWEVVSATRGGVPTSTADGAIFEFDTLRQTFSSNLLGGDRYPYQREEQQVLVRGAGDIERLDILAASDTLLRLGATVRYHPFVFELKPLPAAD